MSKKIEIRDLIASKGLKVTPQRMRVLETIYKLNNHPTAENIVEFIRKNDPNIGIGTVYNVLDTLVENNIITRVKTDKGIMRYDGVLENHHHLYCIECDYIEDYKNENLDNLLQEFFKENQINNFNIEDIRVSINGNFIIHKNKLHD
ncbi:MAG TPA: transcriptional repressor [Prolixibacteraceae bacterium]|nr:transcriptional repressor [Prolixibacteraceae bacterium]